jgi:hypothetical protein
MHARRLSLSARRSLVLAAVLLVAIVAAACGKDTTSVGVGSGGPAGTTNATGRNGSIPPAVPAGPVKGVAGSPVLEWGSNCYGECGYLVPTGLAQVAVYDDGLVVVFTHVGQRPQGTSVAPVRGWTERRLTLDPGELTELVDLARRGGLAEGGVHNNGTTEGTADGGGSVFVARIDGATTSVEAPFLAEDDSFNAHTDRPDERKALAALQKRLRAFEDDARSEDVSVEQWGLAAYAFDQTFVGDVPGTPPLWGGRDLDGLPGTYGKARCDVIADGELDAAVPSMPSEWSHVRSGERVWSLVLIPLLPHQHTCADLQASLDDVHADELGKLISAY